MWIFFLLGTIFGAWAKNTWHIMAPCCQMLPAGPLQQLQDLRPSRLGQLLCKAKKRLQGAFAERLLDKDALFIPAFATTFLGVVYMTLRLHVIHSAGTFRMTTVAL